MERTLDRLVQFDEKSREYGIRQFLEPVPLKTRSWACRNVLDQGREGACVGFAWAADLLADPISIAAVNDATARMIYKSAQAIDAWPGEDYEGTSVIAGAKVLFGQGYQTEYRWAFGISDVMQTLSQKGPVVLGIPWLDTMFRPDDRGMLDCSGDVVGGHAILARGVKANRGKPIIKLRNSWGPAYGINGDVYVTADDLEKLLHMDGEACIPVIRKRPKVAA